MDTTLYNFQNDSHPRIGMWNKLNYSKAGQSQGEVNGQKTVLGFGRTNSSTKVTSKYFSHYVFFYFVLYSAGSKSAKMHQTLLFVEKVTLSIFYNTFFQDQCIKMNTKHECLFELKT